MEGAVADLGSVGQDRLEMRAGGEIESGEMADEMGGAAGILGVAKRRIHEIESQLDDAIAKQEKLF